MSTKTKTPQPEQPKTEPAYTKVLVFQQAICSNCQKMVIVQQLRVFTEFDALEKFALGAHNSLVRNAGLLCVTPQLTIFYGHALTPTHALQQAAPETETAIIDPSLIG